MVEGLQFLELPISVAYYPLTHAWFQISQQAIAQSISTGDLIQKSF
jgi:hypothetical protein